jgi:uncharacterized protein with GYD domain
MMSPGAGSGLEVSIVMLFILSLNFTDQGIRNIKESPKRAKVARELAKKIGVEIKQVYLTSGASDLVVLAETENGDNIAKLALGDDAWAAIPVAARAAHVAQRNAHGSLRVAGLHP